MSDKTKTEPTQEERSLWLVCSWMNQQVPTPMGIQNVASRVVSWDLATKEEMETFYKKNLGQGTHFLVPIKDSIKIENLIQESGTIEVKAK